MRFGIYFEDQQSCFVDEVNLDDENKRTILPTILN